MKMGIAKSNSMGYNSLVEIHEGDMTMPQRGGKREGSGRTPLPESEKKIAKTIYITPTLQSEIDKFANGNSFSEKCIDLISSQIARRKRTQDKTVKFIDLFAGHCCHTIHIAPLYPSL